jgi:ABC-type sugar transport system substrate-binding protein
MNDKTNDNPAARAFNRKAFLSGTAGAAAGAAALVALPGFTASRASAAGEPASAKRTVALVFSTNIDWMLGVAVGAADAARMVGWRFERLIGSNPATDQTAYVTAILQAIQTHPDVILTADWSKGETGAVHQAQRNHIEVVIVNAEAFPADMAGLGVSFAGQDEVASGVTVGTRLLDLVTQKGKKSGVILAGNPFPGPGPIQSRVTGLSSAAAAYNKAHRTNFQVVQLNDQASASPAQAIALYKAELARLDSQLVAHAVPGGVQSLPPLLTALQESRVPTGSVPIGSWDNSQFILNALQSGQISFFEDQGFYYQGYFGVLLAWAARERITLPINVNTGGRLVDKSGLAQYMRQNSVILAAAKGYGFM